ncbi:MAG: NUDIX hydrolase [Patescibacteria group bacterium]
MGNTAHALNPIVHGVQAIVMINSSYDILNQKYLVVQDANDRGTGTGIKKYGLCGGGIEIGETPLQAIKRELKEELCLKAKGIKSYGCFQKERPSGINNNYLFLVQRDRPPKFHGPNEEVCKAHVLDFQSIIALAQTGVFHEGSIRLLLHFLNGTTTGSLDKATAFREFTF